MSEKTVDLVLEGGGVKGIGLLGAVLAMADAGYRFERIAGTSAGAHRRGTGCRLSERQA
ncbi:MAG TPA: patatin-like phospholipase family protein [Actinophytocola sp.]|jgi:NTE family protein|nr:patatin-like phospholipase family protein [Actinophytocola sp.]